jgi:hypothetical protein
MERVKPNAAGVKPQTHHAQQKSKPDPWGIAVMRSACSTPAGRVNRINQSFIVTGDGARFSRRWSPGQSYGDYAPDAMHALSDHAGVWERASREGKPTVESPNARPAWEGKRAA